MCQLSQSIQVKCSLIKLLISIRLILFLKTCNVSDLVTRPYSVLTTELVLNSDAVFTEIHSVKSRYYKISIPQSV